MYQTCFSGVEFAAAKIRKAIGTVLLTIRPSPCSRHCEFFAKGGGFNPFEKY